MAERLWGRKVYIDIGTVGGTATRYEGLRVGFSITMSRKGTPDEGTITIYNLPNSGVSILQSKDAYIAVYAGYTQARRIFVGNPLLKNGVQHQKRGADRVTTVKANAGGKAYREARVNITYRTDVSFRDLVHEVVDSLGVDKGEINVATDYTHVGGITLQGLGSEMLNRFAESSDSDFMIQDNAAIFIPKSAAVSRQAVLFSADAGNLIGSPTVSNDGEIEVVGLIAPDMRPGRRFQVQSMQFDNVQYTASEVQFDGDSDQGPFYVKIKGV